MRKTARIAAVVSIAALVLAGCGERDSGDDNESSSDNTSETTSESTSTDAEPAEQFPDFKACMVSDSGGFDDKSFNQTSHDGMEAAAEKFGVQTGQVESSDPAGFADNIDSMVKAGCNQVTTVGFLLGDSTEAAAKKNPKVDFAIVDYGYEKPAKNLKGLGFATAEPSFLAGYLAAGYSESGVVGTFGGQNIPTVTIFMDGYAKGVAKYNEDNGTDVKVVGWNPENQQGTFTNDFEDKTKGQATAEEMITQGADVVFPVAGPAGLGGLQAAQDKDIKAIWVDTDGCQSAEEYCDVLLTSVMKGMDVAVEQAILDSAEGKFDNTPYEGTLENGGVGLAPYGDDVDSELSDKVEELKQQFIDGSLTVE